MDLRDYFRIIRKRGWIIIAVGLIAALAALGVSKLQTPTYLASIQLTVEPARLDWSLSQTLKDALNNYVVRLNTHKMATKVIERAQLGMGTDELLSKLTVSSDASNYTIQIDAKHGDPTVARLMAQTMAELFVQEREDWNKEQDKVDQVAVSIVDNVRQAELYSPKTKMNTLLGLIFGFVVGGVIVFVMEWIDSDIVRSADDVERCVGWTVLGAIPAGADSRRKAKGLAKVGGV